MPQRFGSEHQGIDIELPQIFGGFFLERRKRLAGFRKRETAVIGAVGIRWQVAASMRGAQLEARKTVERAIENQMRERDGGVERIADHVGEQPVALQPFLKVG